MSSPRLPELKYLASLRLGGREIIGAALFSWPARAA